MNTNFQLNISILADRARITLSRSDHRKSAFCSCERGICAERLYWTDSQIVMTFATNNIHIIFICYYLFKNHNYLIKNLLHLYFLYNPDIWLLQTHDIVCEQHTYRLLDKLILILVLIGSDANLGTDSPVFLNPKWIRDNANRKLADVELWP